MRLAVACVLLNIRFGAFIYFNFLKKYNITVFSFISTFCFAKRCFLFIKPLLITYLLKEWAYVGSAMVEIQFSITPLSQI